MSSWRLCIKTLFFFLVVPVYTGCSCSCRFLGTCFIGIQMSLPQARAVLSGMHPWLEPLRLCSRYPGLACGWFHDRLRAWAGGRNLHASARGWSSASKVYQWRRHSHQLLDTWGSYDGPWSWTSVSSSCWYILPPVPPHQVLLGASLLAFLQPSWPQWHQVMGPDSWDQSSWMALSIISWSFGLV